MRTSKALMWGLMGTTASLLAFSHSTFRPPAVGDSKIEAQLARSEGQTEFLNPYTRFGAEKAAMAGAPGGAGAESARSGTAQRAIQESDVFKVGTPGSKLLYLLNNYRGLQVVSFEAGPESPRLLGRVAATGNNPDDMYFDAANQRIYALERLWYDESGRAQYWSEAQSRIVVYDVSNPAQPKISQTVEIKGEVADSRLVGDVLYVASSVRPNYYDTYNRNKEPQGYVTSFSLSGREVAQIEEYKLTLPASHRENMNIVEIAEGEDRFSYYIVAVLSQSGGWSWNERQSEIEVVDITNPDGDIVPLMKAAAKGAINERSQTLIKDRTLIAVSNYFTQPQTTNDRGTARVAVETFVLPKKDSEVISESEAEFRQLWVERELRRSGEKDPEKLSQLRQKLLTDSEMGLSGRFVQSENGILTKPVADSVVTVGDTRGMSASLQDVRVEGNSLYAFWVPTDRIDPLDVFDISNPQQGIKHAYHLEFEGWIERAFPVNYKDRQYVIGMGWVQPAVDNETGRRQAQALLFEIMDRGGQKVAFKLAELQLSERNAWGQFNAPDKFMELNFATETSGQILFSQSAQVDEQWVNGGKLINFDFSRIDEGRADEFFREGGFLVGDSSWLRRVFTNPEINRINSFSDQNLGVFEEVSQLEQGGLIQAAAILELARNVEAYVTLGTGEQKVGLQIVRSNAWSSWYITAHDPASVEIRAVPLQTPDQELHSEMARVKLQGDYAAHYVDSRSQSLLVMTREWQPVATPANEEGQRPAISHVEKMRVYRVSTPDGTKLAASTPVEWSTEVRQHFAHPFGRAALSVMPRAVQDKFVTLADGRVVTVSGTELKEFTLTAESLELKTYALEQCEVSDPELHRPLESTESKEPRVRDASMEVLSGRLYMSHKEVFELPDQPLWVARHFLAPVALNENKAVCGTKVNIPGQVLALEGDNLITQDEWALDILTYQTPDWREPENSEKKITNYEFVTATTMASLKLDQDHATLWDLYGSEDNSSGQTLKKVGDNQYLYVTSPEQNHGYWRNSDYPGNHYFVFVSFDNYRFRAQTSAIRLETSQSVRLTDLISDPQTEGRYLGVLQNGRMARVVSFQLSDKELEVVPVKVSLPGYETEVKESFLLPQSFGWWMSDAGDAHYSPDLKTIEFAQGLYGVLQVQLQQ